MSVQRAPDDASAHVRVTYEDVLEFAAADVWPFFDWRNLERMLPGGFFADVNYHSREPIPGATRTVRLADGVGNGHPLREVLIDNDCEAMRLRYRIDDPAPMPVAAYSGEVSVEPIDSTRCRVRFESVCVPNGIDASTWRDLYRSMQRANLEFIAKTLQRI